MIGQLISQQRDASGVSGVEAEAEASDLLSEPQPDHWARAEWERLRTQLRRQGEALRDSGIVKSSR
jgi:hypothetical protein